MGEPLAAGRWLNRSPRRLFLVALGTALTFALLCLAILAFTTYYIACPETPCEKVGTPTLLVVMSGLLALIPTIGFGVLGWFIVRGLLQDSRRIEAEDAERQGGMS